ncbi:hypothetical protein HN681_01995 [archaeon]|mgnify:CR=1 FL=1|jgi:hypothetical protein|nr:hypothetical protein [archaeon]MBT3731348.1 hypothetical protein [archaeon]MBT4670349.1 hypothetical protein [archaeon]MBT5029633.1 hypothetical protein [archaeon]MBT5287618.1 hypothetical protein [archaeon]
MSLVERVVEMSREAFQFVIEPGCQEGSQYFKPVHRDRNYCATGNENCKYAENVPKGQEAGFTFVGTKNGEKHEEPTEIQRSSCHYCNKI